MVLCVPLGKEIVDPSEDDVRELLNQKDVYWEEGCGSASLSIDKVENCDEFLMFYRDSKYGYVVVWNEDHGFFDEGKDKNLVIAHNIGGEPFPVPECFYTDYTQTEKILLHYLQTGSILEREKWRSISEIFDYDAYLESDEYSAGVKVFRTKE